VLALETGNRYIIGDIHGCNRTFGKLLKKINLSKSDELYLLGDMINRGNDSSGVLNRIIKLKNQGFKIFPLKGNHENMLLTVLSKEPERLHQFLRFYKSADLLSIKGKIKKKYIELLQNLPLYYELDKFILVHATLDLSGDNIFDNETFMLSGRYLLGDLAKLRGKTLIHGHTVAEFKSIENSIKDASPIISIDNGCIYGKTRKGFGKLICLNIDTMEIISKTNCEND
jgi:serine/threonine protein phosphatase 1